MTADFYQKKTEQHLNIYCDLPALTESKYRVGVQRWRILCTLQSVTSRLEHRMQVSRGDVINRPLFALTTFRKFKINSIHSQHISSKKGLFSGIHNYLANKQAKLSL